MAALALCACEVAQGKPDAAPPGTAAAGGRPVTALGRIRPKHGLLRIAGPSDQVVVIKRLFVEEGDLVRAGQRIALLDTFAQREAALSQVQAQRRAREADVARLQAELENARSEHQRQARLYADGLLPTSQKESADLRLQVAEAALTRARADLTSTEADLRRAQVELERGQVRAPVDARVVKLYARPGERVGPSGIAELARTDGTYAVAEVYETEVGRVRVGQRAVVRIAALGGQWEGTVERIGMKIGKVDVLGTDPAARTDARVVEVEVRLDDGSALAGLTNMQVEVLIGPN
ncbi:MAG TPA: HlyD family efflux transporter periplasmic adaptor subunit [Vicinamibacteria bacterium]|jgi:HlyD family secretion protein